MSQTFIKFIYDENQEEIKRSFTFSIGNEERVAQFLVNLTNGELYKTCLLDLQAQAEKDPALMQSFLKVTHLIKEALQESMNRPYMLPSQTFKRGQ